MNEKIHVSIILKDKPHIEVNEHRAKTVDLLSGLEIEEKERAEMSKEEVPKSVHYEILGNNALRWLVDPDEPRFNDYEFENIFPASTTMRELYYKIGHPIVHKLLQGINCTVMTFGHTESGKEETLIGDRKYNMLSDGTICLPSAAGLLPRIGCALWENISELSRCRIQTEVTISFIDVFSHEVRDLLAYGETRAIRESIERGLYIEGLTTREVKSYEEMMRYYDTGHQTWLDTQDFHPSHRVFSNRIFSIGVKQRYKGDGDENGSELIVKESELVFILMQGNERRRHGAISVGSSSSTGLRNFHFVDSCFKNCSVFGNVVCALTTSSRGERRVFVPYRDSKFTRLLSNRLHNNCSFYLLAHVLTGEKLREEGLSSLRYSNRIKQIDQFPRNNEINFSHEIAEQNLLILDIALELEKKNRRLVHLLEDSSEREKLLLDISELENTRNTIRNTLTSLQNRFMKEMFGYDLMHPIK